MPKVKTAETIKAMAQAQNRQYVTSCNAKSCLRPDTKLVIVGTLTPPEGKGYFYTAPTNKMFARIDEYLGTQQNGLVVLKNKLYSQPESIASTIDQINAFLAAHKIAFLDVMQYAIRKVGKEHSALDEDIEFCSLDFDAFSPLKKSKSVTVVCNSRLALDYFNRIKKELQLPIEPQYAAQYSWRISKEALESRWQEIFNLANIGE